VVSDSRDGKRFPEISSMGTEMIEVKRKFTTNRCIRDENATECCDVR
jgi:hypothetical protein